MKRIVITILALLYISTATGITVHLHYCMGKLAGWELWAANKNDCSKCGMEKGESSDDCCKDTQHQLKIKADQKTAPLLTFFSFEQPITDAPVYTTEWLKAVSSTDVRLPFSHAPPESEAAPIYLLHRDFRI